MKTEKGNLLLSTTLLIIAMMAMITAIGCNRVQSIVTPETEEPSWSSTAHGLNYSVYADANADTVYIVADENHTVIGKRGDLFPQTTGHLSPNPEVKYGDEFGFSVALYEDPITDISYIVVGAPSSNNGHGAAYVFSDDKYGWRQIYAMTGHGTNRGLGFVVHIEEDSGEVVLSVLEEDGFHHRVILATRSDRVHDLQNVLQELLDDIEDIKNAPPTPDNDNQEPAENSGEDLG